MDKTISSSCYDAIIIKQPNKTYKSTAFQVVFSSAHMKQIEKNRSKNIQPYKLTMFVNEQEVILPIRIDDVGRVVFQKEYLRKMSTISDSSDVSDDEYSQKSSTRDSRFYRTPLTKAEKFEDLKNEQAPKNFWQFAWLFKENKKTEPPPNMASKIEQTNRLDQIKLQKIKQEVYEGEENSKQPLFHLSLCGNLLKKKQDKEQILRTFYEHRVQYKDFIKDPPTFINDSNLVVKIDDSIYTWQLGIAILTCRFAYGKQLSKELIEDITKNKFTKSKLFTFFTRDPITKLQLKDSTNDKSKQTVKPATSGFRKIEKSDLSILKYKKAPETETIKKMKLKYGKNEAKFVLDVGIGVKEEISMKIFLWDSSEKFVISDIDGTITKSDILGQILNKWIHPGVTKLFTEICKRQYKIIYLTARAIGQYQQTCKFLSTVEQDEVYLPEGPLLMSPDGYMRSLTRQMIYKTPDYLKTKILAGINELFPNSKTPIYCGFGNRETDSLAYQRINIPADKIFEISEKSLITKLSDKQFTTTYMQILDNIGQYFPQYLKEVGNQKSSDSEEIEEFEAVGIDNMPISKSKSLEQSMDRDFEGFDEQQLFNIQNISRSRKSEHEIPQEQIKNLQQFIKQNTEFQLKQQKGAQLQAEIQQLKNELRQAEVEKQQEEQLHKDEEIVYIIKQAMQQHKQHTDKIEKEPQENLDKESVQQL